MGLWSKGIKRSETGAVRKEDDKTNMIDEFFANQIDVVSYEIADEKNCVINIEGSLHLNEDDLDNGELFFKIGKLSGNMYCHFKHIKPALIPAELGGEIVYVPDEEELWKNKQAAREEDDLGGMGFITEKKRSKEDLITNIKLAFADLISTAQTEGVDLKELWDEVLQGYQNKDKYKLRIEFDRNKLGKVIANIYVSDNNEDKLDLNPVQTLFYLMFVMSEDGYNVEKMKAPDWIVAKQIYSQLANTEQKTYIKNKKTGEYLDYKDGLLDKPFSPSTINSYLSEIRKKLEKLIPYQDVRTSFSIVGKRGSNLKIEQSTQELRDKICEEFGFD